MVFIKFEFPWSLTAIHTLFSGLGCFALVCTGFFKPSSLGKEENIVMLMFSFLYTINIAISNVSLNMVSVPFHQVVRATTPIFAIILNISLWRQSYSMMTYLSLIPVIAGVGFATMGDYSYTMAGLYLTFFGTFLAALKTVVTNRVQVGKLKLHPLELILRMSPLAFIQCMLYAGFSGEASLVVEWAQAKLNFQSFNILCLNGIIAFFLNVVSFTANKKTSALTMTVAANVKQVLSIVIAVMVFNLTITALNAWGIFLTILGGAIYGYVEYDEKKRCNNDSK